MEQDSVQRRLMKVSGLFYTVKDGQASIDYSRVYKAKDLNEAFERAKRDGAFYVEGIEVKLSDDTSVEIPDVTPDGFNFISKMINFWRKYK